VHDDEAELCKDSKGNLEPNPDLRDYENVPLSEDIHEYFEREVKPHVPLAWIDEKKKDAKDGKVGIVGYEIPFNRHFYEYKPPRDLEEIDAELESLTKEIMEMLREI
jgi:type I restriction enzyme M protein